MPLSLLFFLGVLSATADELTRTNVGAGDGERLQEIVTSREAWPSSVDADNARQQTVIHFSKFQDQLENDVSNDFERTVQSHTISTRAIEQRGDSVQSGSLPLEVLESDSIEFPSNDVRVNVDANDVRPGDYYMHIQPTRTEEGSSAVEATQQAELGSQPGEGQGAPRDQGRARSLLEPQDTVSPTAAIRSAGDQRKSNPDIQDIITGIVKLLNGNVKVQVGGAPPIPAPGRPGRPTRINNRGPPRITVPHPYPFVMSHAGNMNSTLMSDTFVAGVPLPEQIVPVSTASSPLGLRPPMPPDRIHQSAIWSDMKPPIEQTFSTDFGEDKKLQSSYPHQEIPITDITFPISLTEESNKSKLHVKNEYAGTTETEINVDSAIQNYTILDKNKGTELAVLNVSSKLENYSPTTTKQSLEASREKDKYDEVNATSTKQYLEVTTEASTRKGMFPKTTTPKIPTQKIVTPKTTTPKTTTKTTTTNAMITSQAISSETSTSPATTQPTTSKTTTKTAPISKSTTPETTPPIANTSKTTTSKSATLNVATPSVPIIKANGSNVSTTNPDSGKINFPPDKRTTNAESTTELLGVGVAEPVLESSMNDWPPQHISTARLPEASNGLHTASNSAGSDFPYSAYMPRPGIVLDDTEYKPSQPTIAAGEIFDVTVTAVQGPGGSKGNVVRPHIFQGNGAHISGSDTGDVSVITMPEEGQHFVSIDGKRTYINLFGSTTDIPSVTPSRIHQGTGHYIADSHSTPSLLQQAPNRRPVTRKPVLTPVRIDTCIVGDDSTCDAAQNEVCQTEQGVSSCHCRPGFSRRKHRDPCRRIVSMVLSLRLDRIHDKRITWTEDMKDEASVEYQLLYWETIHAINSAMSMTPFSDDFMGVNINGLYTTGGHGPVFANVTLRLEETAETLRPAVRTDIRRHLLGAIQRRGNNIGASALWVDSLSGAVTDVLDLDECSQPGLHDCHSMAYCNNIFGTFRCACPEGLRDPWSGNPLLSGRHCETCSPQHCNGHGECRFEGSQQVCHCAGNFYGSQCEIDGEVLGVAVGASLAALVIIVLTLVFLCMWSHRWSKEQKTSGVGSPVFGYMGTAGSTVKTPNVGGPPYQVTLEDRLRWAQIADAMAQANHYAQLDQMNAPTRPSSAVFGYPSLTGSTQVCQTSAASRAMSLKGTHTVESSSSEEEDRADLLGRSFHVPRPKSRSSIANQSGIYYDVEYEPEDVYSIKHHPPAIPLNTYRMGPTSYYHK